MHVSALTTQFEWYKLAQGQTSLETFESAFVCAQVGPDLN